MKTFFLTLVGVVLIMQNGISQCGDATNANHYFNNGYFVMDWDDNPNAVEYIVQFKELTDDWANYYYADTVSASELLLSDVCLVDYQGHWRIITQCATSSDTTESLLVSLSCVPPTNLSSSNITHNNATIQWDNFPGTHSSCHVYWLAYRILGTSTWINLPQVYTNTYVFSNLQANTSYEWCVNQYCVSGPSAPSFGQFTTLLLPCATPPSPPSLWAFTNTSIHVQFPSGAPYSVQYKAASAANWNTLTVNNTFYNFTNLSPATVYQFRIAKICASNNISAYTAISSFSTGCISLVNNAEHLRYIQIKDKSRVSTNDPNGYFYEWWSLPQLTKGLSYTLRIAAGGAVNNQNRQDVAAYLDINNNKIFETSEQVLATSVHNGNNIRTYSFTVPTSAVTGNTVMRIIMLKQNQTTMTACPPLGIRGEVEDFQVTILAPPSSLPINNGISSNFQQSAQGVVAKCKESVTKYISPFSCEMKITAEEIDNGSEGYDYFTLITPTELVVGKPMNYILKPKTNEGEADICSCLVTYVDTVPPVAVLTDNIVVTFFENEPILLKGEIFDKGSYDQCAPIQFTVSPSQINLTDASPLDVTITITDAFGNSNKGIGKVTIVDKTPGKLSETNDIKNEIWNVYPNPTSDKIMLDIPQNEVRSITIVNIMGQVAYQSNQVVSTSLDVTALPQGSYFIKALLDNGKTMTSKFVKQ